MKTLLIFASIFLVSLTSCENEKNCLWCRIYPQWMSDSPPIFEPESQWKYDSTYLECPDNYVQDRSFLDSLGRRRMIACKWWPNE